MLFKMTPKGEHRPSGTPFEIKAISIYLYDGILSIPFLCRIPSYYLGKKSERY